MDDENDDGESKERRRIDERGDKKEGG